MAYGDNYSEVTSDLFGSSIDSDWTNGEGSWGSMAWVTGGYVESDGSNNSLIRDGINVLANDQYAIGTVQAAASGAHGWVGCRTQTGGNERCYLASYDNGGSADYHVYEVTNGPTLNSLASTGTPALSAGDTLTCEVEGTIIRCGSNEGGGDTERISSTDNTLTAGDGCIGGWASPAADNRWTAYVAGDISAGGGGRIMSSLVGVGGLVGLGGIAGQGGGLAG